MLDARVFASVYRLSFIMERKKQHASSPYCTLHGGRVVGASTFWGGRGQRKEEDGWLQIEFGNFVRYTIIFVSAAQILK